MTWPSLESYPTVLLSDHYSRGLCIQAADSAGLAEMCRPGLMRLLLDGAAGPSRECASTCLLVEAVCLEFKLTQVSILSVNGEMQQLLASCNIWEKLNRHPCIQQSCAFGPLGLLCICRLVRQYRARAPSASLYVDTLDTTQSLQRHVLAFVKRSRLLQETTARSS